MTLGVSLSHLERLTDAHGIVEHALGDVPQRDLGYCTDDAGRLLGLVAPYSEDPACERLCWVALAFLDDARDGMTGFRLRRRADDTWTNDPPSDDATGRALEGLGVAVATAIEPVARRARELFNAALPWQSPHPRSMGHAVIGAANVLSVEPEHVEASRVMHHAREVLAPGDLSRAWPWPEPRLTYSNALLVEAQLILASHFADADRRDHALALLEWLVAEESCEGHFSFAPVGGRGPAGPKPDFDQQPIEAWSMASACARAYALTGQSRWAQRVAGCAAWFDGANDAGLAVGVPTTGGGFDGLSAGSVNTNQGAESTLAYLATTLLGQRVDGALKARTVPHATARS